MPQSKTSNNQSLATQAFNKVIQNRGSSAAQDAFNKINSEDFKKVTGPSDAELAYTQATTPARNRIEAKKLLLDKKAEQKKLSMQRKNAFKQQLADSQEVDKNVAYALARDRQRSLGEHTQDAGLSAAQFVPRTLGASADIIDAIANVSGVSPATAVLNRINGKSTSIPAIDPVRRATGALDAALGGEGVGLSEDTARTVAWLESFKTAPLKKRIGTLDAKSTSKAEEVAKVLGDNPTVSQQIGGLIERGKASAESYLKYGTVAADAAIASAPDALIPGKIAQSLTSSVLKKVGKESANVVKKKAQKQFTKTGDTFTTKELEASTAVRTAKARRRFLNSKAGKAAQEKIAERSGVTYTALSEGGTNASQNKNETLGLSEKEAKAYSQYNSLRGDGNTHKEALSIMANQNYNTTFVLAALTAAGASKATGAGAFEGRGLSLKPKAAKVVSEVANAEATKQAESFFKNAVKSSAKNTFNASKSVVNTVGRVLADPGRESVEESIQGFTGAVAQNIGHNLATGDNKDIFEGAPEAAGAGAIVGPLATAPISIPKAVVETTKALAKGLSKPLSGLSNKIQERSVTNEVSKQLSKGSVAKIDEGKHSDILDSGNKSYDPVEAVQAMLHPKVIKAEIAKIKAADPDAKEYEVYAKQVEAHLNLVSDKVEASVSELEQLKKDFGAYAAKLQKSGMEADAIREDDGYKEFATKYKEKAQALIDLSQKEQYLTEATAGITQLQDTEEAIKTRDAINKLEGKQTNSEADGGLDNTTSSKVAEVPKDTKLSDDEVKSVMGSGLFTMSDKALDNLNKQENLSEKNKRKIKVVRELRRVANDASDVMQEILYGNSKNSKSSAQYTGIATHLQRIQANPNNKRSIRNYTAFRDGLLHKLDVFSKALSAINTKTSTKGNTLFNKNKLAELGITVDDIHALTTEVDIIDIAEYMQAVVGYGAETQAAFNVADAFVKEMQDGTPADVTEALNVLSNISSRNPTGTLKNDTTGQESKPTGQPVNTQTTAQPSSDTNTGIPSVKLPMIPVGTEKSRLNHKKKVINKYRTQLNEATTEIEQLNALQGLANNNGHNKVTRAVEQQLKERGYEINDLTGTKYDEGLKVIARFVEDPSIPEGTDTITKVVKPFITQNGKMVQAAEVVVSVGTKVGTTTTPAPTTSPQAPTTTEKLVDSAPTLHGLTAAELKEANLKDNGKKGSLSERQLQNIITKIDNGDKLTKAQQVFADLAVKHGNVQSTPTEAPTVETVPEPVTPQVPENTSSTEQPKVTTVAQPETKGFKLSTDKLGKDQGKADLANSFIGSGRTGSSTAQYTKDAGAAGIPVNGQISPNEDTVAFVSVNGGRGPDTKTLNNIITAAKKVLAAGGTIVMDGSGTGRGQAQSSYNKNGEGAVQAALGAPSGQTSKGYNYWGPNPEAATEAVTATPEGTTKEPAPVDTTLIKGTTNTAAPAGSVPVGQNPDSNTTETSVETTKDTTELDPVEKQAVEHLVEKTESRNSKGKLDKALDLYKAILAGVQSGKTLKQALADVTNEDNKVLVKVATRSLRIIYKDLQLEANSDDISLAENSLYFGNPEKLTIQKFFTRLEKKYKATAEQIAAFNEALPDNLNPSQLLKAVIAVFEGFPEFEVSTNKKGKGVINTNEIPKYMRAADKAVKALYAAGFKNPTKTFLQSLLEDDALFSDDYRGIDNVLATLFTADKSKYSIISKFANLFTKTIMSDEYRQAIASRMGVASFSRLSDNQQNAAAEMYNYIVPFINDYKKTMNGTTKTVNHKDGTTSVFNFLSKPNKVKAPESPMLYFLRETADGTYVLDDNIIAGLAVSAIAYMHNEVPQHLYTDENRIKQYLGIKEKDVQLTNGVYKLLGPVGLLQQLLVDSLGQTFMGAMGLTTKDDAPENELGNIKMDSGSHTLYMLLKTGIAKRVYIPIGILNYIKQNPSKLSLLDQKALGSLAMDDPASYAKNSRNKSTIASVVQAYNPNASPRASTYYIESILKGELNNLPVGLVNILMQKQLLGPSTSIFITPTVSGKDDSGRILPHKVAQKFKDIFSDTESMAYKLFGTTTKETLPTFKEPKNLSDTINNDEQPTSKIEREIGLAASKQPYKLITPMMDVMMGLGIDRIMGLVVGDPTEDNTHADNLLSEQARQESKRRALQQYFDFVEHPQFDNGFDKLFYVIKEFWTNRRVGEANNIMAPQGDKVARSLMGYEGHEATVDTKGSPKDLLWVKFAIGQALGIDIDKLSDSAIEQQFQAVLDSKEYAQQIDILNKAMAQQSLTAEEEHILGTKIFNQHMGRTQAHPLLKLSGIVALKQYKESLETGKPFKTNIHYEVDGITNGFAITLLQMHTGGPTNSLVNSLQDMLGLVGPFVLGDSITIDSNNVNTILDTIMDIARDNKFKILPFNMEDNLFKLLKDSTFTYLGKKYTYDELSSIAANRERLEMTGMFLKGAAHNNSGEFSEDPTKNDSYKDLVKHLLKTRDAISQAFTKKNYAKTKYAIEFLSKINKTLEEHKPSNMSKKDFYYRMEKEGAFREYIGDAPEDVLAFAAAINKTIVDAPEMKKYMKFTYSVPLLAGLIIENLPLKSLDPAFINKSAVRLKERFAASNKLIGKLHNSTPSDITTGADGLLNYAINSLGRNLAKPALLISNYGASIRNIVRTMAGTIVDKVRADLTSIKIRLDNHDITIEEAMEAVAQINKDVKLLTGTSPKINAANMLAPLPYKVITSIQEAVTANTGIILEATLKERYNDLFEARSTMNKATQAQFHLFDAYYTHMEKALYAELGTDVLTKRQRKDFEDRMRKALPMYKTFFADTPEEGIIGPNTEQSLVDITDDKGNTKPNPAFVVRPKVPSGGGTVRSTLKRFTNPSVRIAVMITHSLDAAVQLEFMKRLSDEFGLPILNVHDAAGIANLHPKIAVEMYNESYVHVMQNFSINTSIQESLDETLDIISATAPEVLDKLNSELKENLQLYYGAGLAYKDTIQQYTLPAYTAYGLYESGSTTPYIDAMTTHSAYLQSGNTRKNHLWAFLDGATVSQYAAGSSKGATVSSTPLDAKKGNRITKPRKKFASQKDAIASLVGAPVSSPQQVKSKKDGPQTPDDTDPDTAFNSDDVADFSDFKPTQEHDIDADNIEIVFDNLHGSKTALKQDTPVHTEHLRSVLNDVITKVLNPIKVFIDENSTGTTAAGVYDSSRGILIQIPPSGTPPTFRATDMSAQEVYVHEMLHPVIQKALDHNDPLARKAGAFMREIKNAKDVNGNLLFDATMFLPKGVVKGTPAYDLELPAAQQKYDYIFNNRKVHDVVRTNNLTGAQEIHQFSDGLHEFMVAAATNEAFRDRLIGYTVVGKRESANNSNGFIKFLDILTSIYNYFTSQFKQLNTADVVADELIRELAGITASKSAKTKGPIANAFDAAASYMDNLVESSGDKVASLVGVHVRKTLGIPKNVELNFKLNKDAYKDTIDLVNTVASFYGVKHDSLLSGLINEISPRSKTNNFIRTAFRNLNKSVDKATQSINSNVEAFYTELLGDSLTTQSSTAMYHTILRSDASVFSGAYSSAELSEIYSSDKARTNEINNLIGQLERLYPKKQVAFYKIMMNNLAHYLGTDTVRSDATLLTARAIARQTGATSELNAPKLVGDLAQAEQIIDKIVSLDSLNYMDKSDRELVGQMFTDKPNEMQQVLKALDINKKSRQQYAFSGDSYGGRKGYIKESYDKHTQYRTGRLSDKEDMAREGFVLGTVLQGSATLNNTKDPHVEYINEFADMTQRVSGAIGLADTHLSGTQAHSSRQELMKLQREFKRVFTAAVNGVDAPVAENTTGVLPAYDSVTGQITNTFRYVVSRRIKHNTLKVDTSFITAASRLETHHIIRARTNIHNTAFVKTAKKEYQKASPLDRKTKYVFIGSDAKDQYLEYWLMLPEEMKADIKAEWGKDGFYLPKDGVIMAMGRAKWSASRIKHIDVSKLPPIKQLAGHVNNIAALLLNNKYVNLTESYLREAIKYASDTIVVKTGVVLMGNETSNILSLYTLGVPIKNILKDSAAAVTYTREYALTADNIMQASLKLRLGDSLTDKEIKQHQANIARWKTELKQNPVSDLMDAGIHQTLVEDVQDFGSKSVTSMGRLERKLRENKIVSAILEGKGGGFTQGVSTVLNETVVNHNSYLYKFLQSATQLSDFTARYALHKHNVSQGMKVNESINMIEDTFINYDLPSHPFLQLGNDLGFMMFTKFFFRIQPVIWNSASRNPRRFLMLMLAQGILGDAEDIADSTFTFQHLINKFRNPIDLLTEILGIQLPLRVL